jgi:hypothetical protein
VRRWSLPLSLWIVALLAGPGAQPVAAADATPVPCSEQHPGDGPAGLDLALLCTLDRIRGSLTDAASGAPAVPPAVVIGVVGSLLALVVVGRALRSGDRRRAPAVATTPREWWVCPACRSFNPPAAEHCYGCGITRPPDAAVAPTAESAVAEQRFGRPFD